MRLKETPSRKPSGTKRSLFNIVMVVGIAIILFALALVLMMRGCDGNESEPYSEEIIAIPYVVDSIEDISMDSSLDYQHSIDLESESQLKDGQDKTYSGEADNGSQSSTSKKKPIDPRFQNPDGTYKQPWEYAKYFDDDESDDYEEGYEEGYDDAMDEL